MEARGDHVQARSMLHTSMKARCPKCDKDLDGYFENTKDVAREACRLPVSCPDREHEDCFVNGYTVQGIRMKFA
jgi:hypothetical protein